MLLSGCFLLFPFAASCSALLLTTLWNCAWEHLDNSHDNVLGLAGGQGAPAVSVPLHWTGWNIGLNLSWNSEGVSSCVGAWLLAGVKSPHLVNKGNGALKRASCCTRVSGHCTPTPSGCNEHEEMARKGRKTLFQLEDNSYPRKVKGKESRQHYICNYN